VAPNGYLSPGFGLRRDNADSAWSDSERRVTPAEQSCRISEMAVVWSGSRDADSEAEQRAIKATERLAQANAERFLEMLRRIREYLAERRP
jgi:hypothetical protein